MAAYDFTDGNAISGWDHWLAEMRKSRTWSDQVALAGLAEAVKRPLIVFRKSRPYQLPDVQMPLNYTAADLTDLSAS